MMNLVSIDSLEGKRWEQKTVTPEVPHRDPVTQPPLIHQKEKEGLDRTLLRIQTIHTL